MNFNASIRQKTAIFAALCSVACSSTSATNVGGGGDGNASGSGGATAGSGNAGTGANASAGTDGIGEAGSETGGTGTASPTGDIQGAIIVTQESLPATSVSERIDNYSINAIWGPGSGLACKTTTSGVCFARVCDISGLDGGTPTLFSRDAGDITVTGVGASMATISFGPIHSTTSMGYTPAQGMTLFYKAGDKLTAKGAGGADLPAFALQTLTAPGDIVLTSMGCAGSVCPDLDRTQDLVVTWTGGGAGKVGVLFETDSDVSHVDLTCDFDATAGTGTVPHALLMLLGKADSDVTSGIETILSYSRQSFTVGSTPTIFEAEVPVTQGLLTVSK